VRATGGLPAIAAGTDEGKALAMGLLVAHPGRLSREDVVAAATALRECAGFEETLDSLAWVAPPAPPKVPVTIAWGERDRLLPRRSRRTARVDADRTLGAWRLGASIVAQGARYDDVQNTIRMGGYATVDLRAERALGAGWTLQAALRNAFDRDYETAAYYAQPGREWSLVLRYAPGR